MAAVGREAMSDEQSDGFLGRWSRRKVQARTGQPLAEPSVPPVAAVPAPAPAVDDLEVFESNRPPELVDTAQAAINNEAKEPAPAPTLDDVKALTIDSDFQPFVARSVAPEVRNAAFKKLFADPHFNVMDGLDIYIDDYSKPSPLPAELLRKMVSAQFLQMVEEEKPASGEPPGTPSAQAAPGEPGEVPTSQSAGLAEPVPAQPPALPDSPALGAEAVSTVSPPISAHDHPDLQLQPDHAPRRGGTESGA